MSLPPVERSNTSLPSLNKTATRSESQQEILNITFEDDADDANAISVSFAGAGFDIDNDEIILDLLRLAANSYGYDLHEIDS